MVKEHGVSHHQACKEVGIARSSYHYHAREKKDNSLIELLQRA
jgi:hypothetical protein